MQPGLELGGDAPAPAPPPADALDHAGGLVLTTNAVADLFGVSAQAVRKWVSSGMPRAARGRFELGPVMQWWLARRDVNATAAAESARESLLRAQERKVSLETDELEGTLMAAVDHEAVLTAVLGAVAEALEGAPQRLSRDPQRRAELEELTHAARQYVADQLVRLADRKGGRPADGAAATPKARRRVGRPSPIATRR